MIKYGMPIKCLEAVILSIHLTNDVVGMDRFPITFKESFRSNTDLYLLVIHAVANENVVFTEWIDILSYYTRLVLSRKIWSNGSFKKT